MNSKKVVLSFAMVILILVIGLVIFIAFSGFDISRKKDATLTSVDQIDININCDNGDEKIDWSKYKTKEIVLSDSLVINEGGIYKLSGTIKNGYIKINVSDNVKLELNNVNITNSSGPAIYVEKAEDVVIHLLDGTVNTLSDGNNYVGYNDKVNGAIYSEDDMTLEGSGTLNVTSKYADGIVSKNDLKFVDGNYIINSADDGIRGKDSVYIKDGSFEINSKGNGIKTTNTTDADKGFIRIKEGNFKINSELDAIQAETKILIQGGEYLITTGGGSNISSTSSSWGNWNNSTTTQSAKGIKASGNLVIENGDFSFDTSDDAIHSKKSLGIKNGNISIKSGDDGIHADAEFIIDGGNIDISKSLEGIEAAGMVINSGNINIVSIDDGINVAGGSDSSSISGRRGQNEFSVTTAYQLIINGGEIHVNSVGDGIDVNGSIYVNDGSIIVEGPENNENAGLDYDGELIVVGGEIIASGASGMAQSVSDNSSQYTVMINFTENIVANSKVTIIDKSDKEVISYVSSKSYSSLVVSSNKFSKGEYKIMINDKEYDSFTIEQISTILGEASSFRGVRKR